MNIGFLYGLLAGLSVFISMIPYLFINAVPVWYGIFYLPISFMVLWFYYEKMETKK